MNHYPIPPGGLCLSFRPTVSPGTALWVDGTVRKGRLAGGAWATCSDKELSLTWAFAVQAHDSTLAELLALDAALDEVPAQMLEGAVVYTDSYQLIQHLERAQAGAAPRYAQLGHALSSLHARGVSQLRNVDRRFNKRADALARLSLPGGR